jgi:signal transduction histidine kinase
LAINAFSALSVAITAFFSEQQRKKRHLHQSFRQRLRDLSQQMLHIHDEKTLFSNLLQTLQSSSFIQQVFLLLAKGSASFEILPGTARVELPPAFLEELKQSPLLLSQLDALQSITSPGVNVAIPVRSNETILAIIALQMNDKDDPINREDLNLLQQLANQTAIALDNIRYIEHTARLTREITESRLQKKYLKQLEATNRQLDEKNKQLTRLFKELREKESQLIHSEKMAALGQMVAGISHELNNPVSFIYANSQALEEALNELKSIWNALPPSVRSDYATQFQELVADIHAIISDNLKGSQSIRELVQQLKNFSRIDQAQWKKASVVEGLESTLRLLKHQMGERIRVIKKYEADPEIFCNPAQLNQVFTNLLLNAIQAIEGKGTITIHTSIEKDRLFIRFSDTGKGIPPEVLPKIFDPFFTTKDVNQGTGLGLSISYSIIEKHGGTIEVESQEGRGTTITLILPLNHSKPKATNHE